MIENHFTFYNFSLIYHFKNLLNIGLMHFKPSPYLSSRTVCLRCGILSYLIVRSLLSSHRQGWQEPC